VTCHLVTLVLQSLVTVAGGCSDASCRGAKRGPIPWARPRSLEAAPTVDGLLGERGTRVRSAR